MRYVFLTGVLTLVLAAGLTIIKAGDACAQQRVELRPVQVTGPTAKTSAFAYSIIGQPGQEAQTDEMAQLNNLDAQLGQEAESLVKQLADATDEKNRAKLKESLADTLTKQFDTQQKVRELEVAAIEARVKKLRDVINKRNEARRSIIDKRLDQLQREADGLGWNSPSSGAGWGQHVGRQVGNDFWNIQQPATTSATPRER